MPQSESWPFHTSTDENANGVSSVLQKQLGDMEGEVKEIQMELAAIRRDRLDLYNRKQLKAEKEGITKEVEVIESLGVLQGDKCSSFTDISNLREELIRARNAADRERVQREKYEEKLRDLEIKLNNIVSTGTLTESKEIRERQSDDERAALLTQIRDLRERLEDLRITLTEKSEQLQEYRVKYLQAEQQAEELRRQLEAIEYDNKQVLDEIQIEIQKMKVQFQEKLQELSPLPDLLKAAQIHLQEAKQLQLLAEDNSQQLHNELHKVNDKLVMTVNTLNQEKADAARSLEENFSLKKCLEEKQREVCVLQKELDDCKCKALRIEEKFKQQELRFREKGVECGQVLKELEELRSESARALARSKERSDSMRRYLQTQVSELERQLVQSRAQCRTYQKQRDEIRQRMELQLNNLQKNFELVEIRIKALQTQTLYMDNNFTMVLGDEEETTDF